ncbi:TPA: acyltransferase family protein [Serratia marcescens]|nr:acyltransferase family protein [Serratia marcescens]
MSAINKEMSSGIDLARSVSCFLVVLLHVAGYGFYENGPNWSSANLIDSFTRVCVPVFIMITGALLIRDEPSKPVKKIVRVVVCILFWSAFYSAVDGEKFNGVINWFLSVIETPKKYHLWYLYVCIGFYISIPLLRKFYMHSEKNSVYSIVILWVIISSTPVIEKTTGFKITELITKYQLNFLSLLLGYLVLGRLIYEKCERSLTNKMLILSFFSYAFFSVITAIATNIWSNINHRPDALFYSNLSPFVIAASAAFFSFLLLINKSTPWIHKFTKFTSKLTLGIYCIHIFFLEIFIKFFFENPTQLNLSAAETVLIAILIFSVSMISVWVLNKIKPLRTVL